ncbi:putative metal-binding motif-containing protein [Patescibacteria group bacterium]|jgi:hypothetical protein|nr:putative metal-binding motif-containing protein [Patescibacteria group bacterium]
MRKSFFLIIMLIVVLWPSVAGCATGGSHERSQRRDAGVALSFDGGSLPMPHDAGSSFVPPAGMDAGFPMDAGAAPSFDAGSFVPRDAGRAEPDAGHPVSPMRESCNGLDDDGDGAADEDFLCPLGRIGELCVTSCGALGDRRCEAPGCSWSTACYPRAEICDTIDNNCDGRVDEGCGPVSDPRLMRIALNPAMRDECPAGWRIRLWFSSPPEESPAGGVLERLVPATIGPTSAITFWCDERIPQWYVWDASDHDALGSGVFSELSLGGTDLRASTRICEDPLSPGTGVRPIIMWDTARRGSCPP